MKIEITRGLGKANTVSLSSEFGNAFITVHANRDFHTDTWAVYCVEASGEVTVSPVGPVADDDVTLLAVLKPHLIQEMTRELRSAISGAADELVGLAIGREIPVA